ncbi:XRE family transcriptional regulator [Streptomyces sp. I05A-00742]|uniref:XRE family transcriptional regulator n=1 Tax=Streptomyces sp. I05A-00742 TaxID=2732853 RepID=UPI00289A7667|nr:XRE family transcriptional regulator [Streptomyces sp. I05A-00742]
MLESMFGLPLDRLGFIRPGATGRTPLGNPEARPAVGVRASARGKRIRSEFDLTEARHHDGRELIARLRAALEEAARTDGRSGPGDALPGALDVVQVVAATARDVRTDVRRELLALGSRAAELTAWLYHDSGAPAGTVLYWHDRAIEWADLCGDGAMHGYVLLRKAQATGRTDPARMRDLAHAAVHGPWSLPLRARAEALQQEARAMALGGAEPEAVARLLDQAHEALGAAPPVRTVTCTGPLCGGYDLDRLLAQSAVCHREAGRPERAVVLLREHVATGEFAPRDRAFFTAHLTGALAAAGEPDEAAATGLSVLRLAAVPRFGQALRELRRAVGALRPYGRRPAVRELRLALASLPV